MPFALNILKLSQNLNKECTFPDIKNLSQEDQDVLIASCEIGLMGLRPDGIRVKDVYIPNTPVEFNEFVTVYSRMLYDGLYNVPPFSTVLRYSKHLTALKRARLVTDSVIVTKTYVEDMLAKIQANPDLVKRSDAKVDHGVASAEPIQEEVTTSIPTTPTRPKTETQNTSECPLGDTSGDPTDGICYAAKRVGSIANSLYSVETDNAYLFAYKKGLTEAKTIQRAEINSLITRAQFARMVSLFAMNVLHKTPDTSLQCSFTDMRRETQEMQDAATVACQLGIMGRDTSGQPNIIFNPRGYVTQAHVATILSRLLR